MTNFYFWGFTSDTDKMEEVWQALHDHFEKLAREDDETEEETVEGKGATK